MFKTEKAQLRVQLEGIRHNCQIEVWRRGHPECQRTHHWKEDKGDHGKVQERDPIEDQEKIQERGLTEDQRKVLHKLHVKDRLEERGHQGDQEKDHLGLSFRLSLGSKRRRLPKQEGNGPKRPAATRN